MNNEETRLRGVIAEQAETIKQLREIKNNFKKLSISAIAAGEDIAAERDVLRNEVNNLNAEIEELQNRLDFLRKYFATIKYQLTWLCGNPNPIIAERATRQLEEFEMYIKTYGE